MWTWLLKPSNLIIAALVAALGVTFFAYKEQKYELAVCSGNLGICQKDVAGFQAEITSANGIIEALKKNLEGIKDQMREWQLIASEANEYAERLLAAAEAKVDCEVYNEENARLTDEFVTGFNGRVRGKVKHPASSSDSTAPEVLPPASASDPPKGNE